MCVPAEIWVPKHSLLSSVVSPTFILEITKLVTPTVVSWLLVWPGLEILIVIVKVGITHEGTKAVDECIIVELGPHGLSTVRL